MSAQPEPLALAAEFEQATREQWRELVSAVLRKGAAASDAEPIGDPEQALTSRTYEGIDVKPLYTADDALSLAHDGLPGHPPFVRGASASGTAATGWDVRQRHNDADPVRSNRAVLDDLANGATSLWLVVGEGGLPVADLARALDGVYLDLAPIVLDAGRRLGGGGVRVAPSGPRPWRRPRGAVRIAGRRPDRPAGTHRGGGRPDRPRRTCGAGRRLAETAVATVDATVYHDAGASDADELGIAAAVGVAYLRALTDAGLSVDSALEALEFRYAVTADQFLSIAKLRAARRVWDRVAELVARRPSGAGNGSTR